MIVSGGWPVSGHPSQCAEELGVIWADRAVFAIALDNTYGPSSGSVLLSEGPHISSLVGVLLDGK